MLWIRGSLRRDFVQEFRDCSSFYGPTGICIWTPRRVQSVLADTIEKDSQSRRLASEFSRRSAPLSHSTKTGYPQIINKTYTFRDHPVIASSLCKIDLRTIWDLNNSLSNRTTSSCQSHLSSIGSCQTNFKYPHQQLPKALGSWPRANLSNKSLHVPLQ